MTFLPLHTQYAPSDRTSTMMETACDPPMPTTNSPISTAHMTGRSRLSSWNLLRTPRSTFDDASSTMQQDPPLEGYLSRRMLQSSFSYVYPRTTNSAGNSVLSSPKKSSRFPSFNLSPSQLLRSTSPVTMMSTMRPHPSPPTLRPAVPQSMNVSLAKLPSAASLGFRDVTPTSDPRWGGLALSREVSPVVDDVCGPPFGLPKATFAFPGAFDDPHHATLPPLRMAQLLRQISSGKSSSGRIPSAEDRLTINVGWEELPESQAGFAICRLSVESPYESPCSTAVTMFLLRSTPSSPLESSFSTDVAVSRKINKGLLLRLEVTDFECQRGRMMGVVELDIRTVRASCLAQGYFCGLVELTTDSYSVETPLPSNSNGYLRVKITFEGNDPLPLQLHSTSRARTTSRNLCAVESSIPEHQSLCIEHEATTHEMAEISELAKSLEATNETGEISHLVKSLKKIQPGPEENDENSSSPTTADVTSSLLNIQTIQVDSSED